MKSYHKTLTQIRTLNEAHFKAFLDSFDTVLLDCDGVLWLGKQVIEGSPETVNKLQELGKKIFYVSNNSTKGKEEFEEKALSMGFNCTIDQMMAISFLTAEYLKEHNVKKAYIVGSSAIGKELEKVGIKHFGIGPDVLHVDLGTLMKNFVPEPDVDAVVVGFDADISYVKLMKASHYLENPNCHFVATNTDEGFPMANLVIPGAGTFVSAISTCSGRTPVVMGKPNKHLMHALMKQHKLDPKRTLMIGDRCNTDILFGSNCGFQTLLVLTGVTSLEQVKKFKESDEIGLIPDFYTEKLGDLLAFL